MVSVLGIEQMEPRIPIRYFYNKYNGGLFTRLSEYIIYRKIDD